MPRKDKYKQHSDNPKPGRPSVFAGAEGRRRLNEIILNIGGGLSRGDAAILAGVSRESIANEAKRNPTFLAELERAEVMCKKYLLSSIVEGVDEGFRPRAWLLSKKWRNEFGDNPEDAPQTVTIKMRSAARGNNNAASEEDEEETEPNPLTNPPKGAGVTVRVDVEHNSNGNGHGNGNGANQ